MMSDDNMKESNVADTSFYGMGDRIRTAIFDTFNITALHQWQHEMLCKHEKEPLRNGLVVAPTSGGKTIVCVILLIRSMLLEHKDCIFTLPYVAIVSEKVRELKCLAAKLKFFQLKNMQVLKASFLSRSRRQP